MFFFVGFLISKTLKFGQTWPKPEAQGPSGAETLDVNIHVWGRFIYLRKSRVFVFVPAQIAIFP